MLKREVLWRKRDGAHLFLIGRDYHLGDLLWLTAVLAEYRRQVQPGCLLLGLPDRPISDILDRNPVIDEMMRGASDDILTVARHRFGHDLVLHDLRMLPIALAMIRDWRHHLPPLYYRDLWLEDRGQWLATFLHLGPLREIRPVLALDDDDYEVARALPGRAVVLAPHVGRYTLPLLDTLWSRIKGWPAERWIELAARLRREGFVPVTMGAADQAAIPGTEPLLGLPIRQAAGVIDRAEALVSVESGLWFVAAALATPFLIVPWWLPRSVDWPARMGVPYRLAHRGDASVEAVFTHVRELTHGATV